MRPAKEPIRRLRNDCVLLSVRVSLEPENLAVKMGSGQWSQLKCMQRPANYVHASSMPPGVPKIDIPDAEPDEPAEPEAGDAGKIFWRINPTSFQRHVQT